MKMSVLGMCLGVLALAVPSPALGQFYSRPPTSPFYRPPVSPYLNLMRPGLSGINYYGLVRPQVDAATAIQQLQQQQLALAAAGGSLDNAALPTTGHTTRFMNYGRYFFNQGGANAPALVPSATASPTFLGTATTGAARTSGAIAPPARRR
jgi:hypothetical protein